MSFILLGILNSQAAGGAAFPLPGVTPDLWLDASDDTTITESGGSVSQWDNKGTLENFTQATSADQPTTGVSTQNGLNVIDFDFEFLTGSTKSQWTFMHDGTEYFYAIALSIGTTADPDILAGIMGNRDGSNDNIGFGFRYDDRTVTDRITYGASNSGGDANSVCGISEDNFVTPQTTVILSGKSDLSNPTLADRATFFRNTTQTTDTNTKNGTPSSSQPTLNLQIGSLGNDRFPFAGKMAEIIVVSGADATEENRQATVDYLNAKWGVF